MNKELLILTLSGNFISSCIDKYGIDEITDDMIKKCKDLASKVLADAQIE